jgi:hypothetical protein
VRLLGFFWIQPMDKPPPIVLDYASPSTKRRWVPRWVWGLLIAAGCLALALATCLAYLAATGNLLGTTTESLAPKQIEAVGQFKLPPGATNLQARYISVFAFILETRFAIPPDQLRALLDTTHIPQPLSANGIDASFLSSGPDWWIKTAPARFEAGQSKHANNATTQPIVDQYILIDETNPREYVVWFRAIGGD